MKPILFGCQIAIFLLFFGCVSVSPPASNTGTVWGYLSLKARKGVNPGNQASGGYSDRRYRDVEYVNYRAPGFVVVYMDGPPSPAGTVYVELEHGRHDLSFNSLYTAVGVNGTIVIKNSDQRDHILSCPMAKFLRRLEPGEEVSIATEIPGEYKIFVLNGDGPETTVFAASGPFTVVSPTGRWELPNQAPGMWRLVTWHPRFPPTSLPIEVVEDAVHKYDIEIGVDVGRTTEVEQKGQ